MFLYLLHISMSRKELCFTYVAQNKTNNSPELV